MEGAAAARERVSGGRALSHPVMMCVQNTNREALLIHCVVNLSKRYCYSIIVYRIRIMCFIRPRLHCGPRCSVLCSWGGED